MAFWEKLDKSHSILTAAQTTRHAPYELPLASPYADNSHLDRITFESLYGEATPDIIINRTTAMSIPAVAKGRNLICSSIGRMPLVALRGGQPVPDQPAFLKQIEVGVPTYTTVSWIVDHLLFYGMAFLLIDGLTSDGKPKHFRFVPEWHLETDGAGKLTRAFDKPVREGEYIRIDSNNEGFLSYGAEAIREAKEIDRAAAEAGANPVPATILKQNGGTDLSSLEIDTLLARWSSRRRKRFGSTAYLNKNLDVETVGQTAENLLIDGRNYAVLQIARALNLSAWVVDATVAGTSLNYSNSTSRMKELVDFALMPYMASIEQTLGMYLPNGQTVEFDTAVLLRGSFGERMESYKLARESEVYSVAELREMEHLDTSVIPQPQAGPENV